MDASPNAGQKLAQLRQELAAVTGSAERVALLRRAGDELRGCAPAEAESFLAEAVRLAAEAKDNESTAAGLRALSELARLRGDATAARMHADKLLRLAAETGVGRFEGAGHYLAGRVHEDAGEYGPAREAYERARDAWRLAGFTEGCRSALNQLGNLMVLQGLPAAALAYYREFAALEPEGLSDLHRAVNHFNIGWARVQLGHWEDAAEQLFRAVAICEQHGLDAVRFSAVNCLGEMFLKRGKPDRAIEMFSRVVEAGRRGESEPETMRDALVNMGEACTRAGDLAGAERAFREGVVCCEQTTDPQSRAALRWHMAELALVQGKLDEAESTARGAFDLAQSINARREEGEALRVLGLAAGERGDVDTAGSHFERAIKSFEGAEESYELGRARFQYGRLLLHADRGQEAAVQLRHAARVFRNLSIVDQAAEASRLLFRLEMRADSDVALLAAVANLSALGLDAGSFLERALRLLREGLGFDSAAVLAGSRALLVSGQPDIKSARGLCRESAGEPSVSETALCFPVRFGGSLLAWVYLERARSVRAAYQPLVLQAVASMLAAQVHELGAAAEPEPETLAAVGLKYRGVVSRSRRMLDNLQIVGRVAGAPVPVLIRGESGTGKELVARALHESGPRAAKPFVAINCAAMPENLLEAEFFGVEKGAATGVVARKGKFELANGGSVFLDEIGDMSPALQAKLLRVLQEKEFERIGGRQPIGVDVRVIAATNQQLEERMDKGLFRRDLYYRLNAVELELPPLRERKEDIPDLVRHFIGRSSQDFGRRVTSAGPDVLKALVSHRWPGNIRELQNVVERAVVLCDGSELRVEDLPPDFRACRPDEPSAPADLRTARREAQTRAASDVERSTLVECLEKAGWNVSKAAELAGYSRAQFSPAAQEAQHLQAIAPRPALSGCQRPRSLSHANALL